MPVHFSIIIQGIDELIFCLNHLLTNLFELELRLINFSHRTNFLFPRVSALKPEHFCTLLWIRSAYPLRLMTKYFRAAGPCLVFTAHCWRFSGCIPPHHQYNVCRADTGLVHSRVLTETWWTCVSYMACIRQVRNQFNCSQSALRLKLLPNYIFLFKVKCETSFK